MASLPARKLVFVDAAIEDAALLLGALAPDVGVVHLEPEADGLRQIADTLAGRRGVRELHLVAHGSEGRLRLGGTDLAAEGVAARGADFARIRAALAGEALLALYGCRTGAGPDGAALLRALARATGADVAASSTPVGRGGNWVLDRTTDAAAAPDPAAIFGAGCARFPGTLATITVTSTAWNTDTDGEVTLIEAILAANGAGTADAPPTGDGFDRIEFAPGLSGQITVDDSVNIDGVPVLTQDLEILGNGAITVAAGNESVSFASVFGSGIDVTLDTLSFTGFGGLDPSDGRVVYKSDTAGGTVALRNVTVAGSTRPVEIEGLARLEIENSTFFDNDEGIKAGQGEVYIANSSFSNNTTGAIGSSGLIEVTAGTLEIRNSSFQNNTYDRFTSVVGAFDSDTSISGSLFTGNDMLPGDGTTGTIRLSDGTADLVNNTIVNPVDPSAGTAYAVRSENGATGTLANSIVIDDSFGGPVADGGTLGEADIVDGGDNILRDAIPPGLFVDFAGGDWRLQSGAPAIDAGRDGAVPSELTFDLAGNPRILGSAVDIGAYEYVNAAPAVALDNALATVVEDTLGSRRKVADIAVTDDGVGFNDLSLSGPDAALFEIDGAALYLRAGTVIDVSSNETLDVTVEVDDASLGGTPDDTADLSLRVVDLIPGIALDLAPGTAVAEDAPDGTQVGIGRAVTTTGDAPLSLTLSDDAGGRFAIDATGVITIADASLIDYEAATSHTVTAQVSDNEGNSSSLSLTIAVSDVDEPPVFTAIGPFTVREDALAGDVVGDVDATDGDGGAVDAGLTYVIVGGNTDVDGDGEPAFSIDAGSGVVTVNDAGDIAADPGADFSLDVEADDGTSAPTETVFIDVVDHTPPTLISLTPPDDATGVAPGADITLTFDEEIALGTGTIRLVDDGDGSGTQVFDVAADQGTGEGQVAISGATLTINPASPLEELTAYHVEVDAGALTDTADTPNPFAGISGATVFDFTTADVTPPTVASILRQAPTDATTDADAVTFRVTFSEAMDAATVGAADFALSGTVAADGVVGAPVQVDPARYDVTVAGIAESNGTLNLDLAVDATLADMAGNALSDAGVAGDDETYTIANNTPPLVATNAGSTLDEGATDTVTTVELLTTDPEEGPGALTYTLRDTVDHGLLWRDDGDGTRQAGEALAAGDSFTQADIDANRIRYSHDGGETRTDSFAFDVSDGAALVDGQTFAFTIVPVNDAPSVALAPVVSGLPEDADTSARVKVADIVVTDDALGSNGLSLSGADAGAFEIGGSAGAAELFLKAGTALDFEAQAAFDVTVEVDDPEVGDGPDDTASYTLAVGDVNEPPELVYTPLTESVDERPYIFGRIELGDLGVDDDALGEETFALSGPNARFFQIDEGQLFLVAGFGIDHEATPELPVTVTLDDPALGAGPEDSLEVVLAIGDVNEPPSEISLDPATATLPEDTDTSAPVKLADVVIVDDAPGEETITLSGDDAGLFALEGTEIVLAAGAALDFETAPRLAVTVTVDDPALGAGPEAVLPFTLAVGDVNEPPGVALENLVVALPEDTDTSTPIRVADIAVTDDAPGTATLALAGADAGLFQIDGAQLFLAAGAALDHETVPQLAVTVTVDDPALGSTPDDSAALAVAVTDVNEAPTVALANAVTALPEDADTSAPVKIADIVVGDDALGTNQLGLAGADADRFEIAGSALFLRGGTRLDFETAPELEALVRVDDPTLGELGASFEDVAGLRLAVTDVDEPPTLALMPVLDGIAEDADMSERRKVADIAISDDALGTATLGLAGPDAGAFGIDGAELFLKAGVALDHETDPALDVAVTVDDPALAPSPNDQTPLALAVTDVDEPPSVALANTLGRISEAAGTGARLKVADIIVTDDALGTATLALAGADAALFEIDGTELFLKAGTALDHETASQLAVTVTVDDPTLGATPDDAADLSLAILDANEPPGVALANVLPGIAEDADTTARTKVADIVVTDDALGNNQLGLAGADAALFEIDGAELYLAAGAALDHETASQLDVTVTVDDPSLGGSPDATAGLALAVADVNEAPTVALANAVTDLPEGIAAGARVRVADIVVTDDAPGTNLLSLAGAGAALFEIEGGGLFLRPGLLDADVTPALSVTVEVDDPALGTGPEDAAAFDATVFDTIRTGTPGPDALTGTPFADTLSGLAGDDRIEGRGADDLIDGGPGTDTALYAALRADHTVAIGPDSLAVIAHDPGGTGADTLTNVERLAFGLGDADDGDPEEGAPPAGLDPDDDGDGLGDGTESDPPASGDLDSDGDGLGDGSEGDAPISGDPDSDGDGLGDGTEDTLDLAPFLGVRDATEAQLEALSLAYAGLLDRLPDALGLYWYAARLAAGEDPMALARDLAGSAEAQALWGAAESPAALVDLAYETMLEREADTAGDTFWTPLLETGRLSEEDFLLAFLASAAQGGSDDARTLADKADLGVHFAAVQGLGDTGAAEDTLALYDPDDRAGSLSEALAFAEATAAAAASPDGDSQLLVPLRGLIDDPLAGA